MYDRAIAIHEKTNAGLTECYRQSILDYIQESDTPQFYSVLLNSLHHYVRMSTIYTDISYPDCITLYSSMFVPKMYIASLTTDQRVNIISMILRNSVRHFTEEIFAQHLGAIIDDHADHVNIEILQDSILKILLQERDTNYDKFIDAQKTASPSKLKKSLATTKSEKAEPEKAGIQKNHAMVKLSKAFKKSIGDRSALKKRNIELIRKNKLLSNQFAELKTMFLKQIAAQKTQTQVINDLKLKLEHTMDTQSASVQVSSADMTNQSNDIHETLTQTINTPIDSFQEDDHMNSISSHDDDELFSVEYVDGV